MGVEQSSGSFLWDYYDIIEHIWYRPEFIKKTIIQMKGGITMSIYDGVKKAFEQTLLTDRKLVKLKLDFDATASQEKIYTLLRYELSENDRDIKIFVSNNGEEHNVHYSNITLLDYADNDERLKIWADLEGKPTQRFYLFYTDLIN